MDPKMNFYITYSLIFTSYFLLSGCGQLSSLQTGRVLGKGEMILGGAVLEQDFYEKSGSGYKLEGFKQVEMFARRGLGLNVDMGLKFSTGGNVLLDGKYQFLGTRGSKFAVSIGGGFEFQAAEENTILRAHLPLYLSYHYKEKNAIYATPRYVFQYVKKDNNSYFIGLGAGYQRRFSSKISGLLEGSFFMPKTQNSNNEEKIFQLAIGMSYHF